MFSAEQQEYTKDGIPWQEIQFKDNQGCIDMIEKAPRGIIAILAEEGRMPKGTDETFITALTKMQSKNIFYDHELKHNDRFAIKHFAGTVTYKIKNFLEKNKDTLNVDVIKAIKSSERNIMRELLKDEFAGEEEKKTEQGSEQEDRRTLFQNKFAGNNPRDHRKSMVKEEKKDMRLTTTEKFRHDLGKLVATLNASSPHYIRCIKPNELKKPKLFDSPKCMGQLACNGVLETVKLRKAGFSNRMSFESFIDRFFVCLSENQARDKEGITACLRELLKDDHLWAVGHSKVFLRDVAVDKLAEKQRAAWQGKAIILQTFYPMFLCSKKIRKIS